MGNKKVTVQNLEIVRVDAENNLLLVKGAVPGPKKSLVTIKDNQLKRQNNLTMIGGPDAASMILEKEEHTDGKRICL